MTRHMAAGNSECATLFFFAPSLKAFGGENQPDRSLPPPFKYSLLDRFPQGRIISFCQRHEIRRQVESEPSLHAHDKLTLHRIGIEIMFIYLVAVVLKKLHQLSMVETGTYPVKYWITPRKTLNCAFTH